MDLMAIKKGSQTAKVGAPKKGKQATQRTPRQRVMVMGPTGKKRFEWREWGS